MPEAINEQGVNYMYGGDVYVCVNVCMRERGRLERKPEVKGRNSLENGRGRREKEVGIKKEGGSDKEIFFRVSFQRI